MFAGIRLLRRGAEGRRRIGLRWWLRLEMAAVDWCVELLLGKLSTRGRG